MKIKSKSLALGLMMALTPLLSSAATFTGSGGSFSVSPGSVALDSPTFSGGSTTDFSASINMDVTPDLSTIGELTVRIDGDFTGVVGVTFPNLNGGTTAMTMDGSGTFVSTTFTDGSTGVVGGAVTFTIDGSTTQSDRHFYITATYQADAGVSDNETLVNNELLTTWGSPVSISSSSIEW